MRAAALRSDPGTPRGGPVAAAAAARRVARAALPLLLLLVNAVAASPEARAGAWLRAPGEAYAKAAFFGTHGDDQFDGRGRVAPLVDPRKIVSSRYDEVGSSVYAEYGLSRDLTIFGDALIKLADLESIDRRVATDVGGVAVGVPDLRLGARLPIARGAIVAALEPSVSVPLQAVDRSSPAAPRLGTPSAAFALQTSVGAAIPVMKGYAQASAGYRARAGREPDEWFGDLEAGTAPFGPFRLRARFDVVDARGSASGGDASSRMAAPDAGGQDLRRIAPTIAIGWRGGSELSLTWRRAVSGRSALRTTEWEAAYSFLGGAARGRGR